MAAWGCRASASSQQRTATPSQSKQTIVRPTAAGAGRTAGDDDFAGTVEIIPDEANNAIVFKASNRDYKQVLTILKQLDIQPRQVLINVLVAEITLSGSVQYGIEWFLNKNIGSLGGSSGDYTAQGALGSNIPKPINTPLGATNGFFFTVYDPVDFLRGLVFALGSDSDVNILSSPNILALDNKEATIEVGADVPTVYRNNDQHHKHQQRHQHGSIPENRHYSDRNAPHQFQWTGQNGAGPGSQRSRRFQQGTQ